MFLKPNLKGGSAYQIIVSIALICGIIILFLMVRRINKIEQKMESKQKSFQQTSYFFSQNLL